MQAGGDLCPCLLEGAGEGGLLDPGAVKAPKEGVLLIACAKCGCSVVGEIKKQRYVYCHCIGYADKCQGNPTSCRRSYVREELLEQQFIKLLGRLKFDDEVLEWVRDALHASHADERREHEEAIKRHDGLVRSVNGLCTEIRRAQVQCGLGQLNN
jgi:hypothetical protein